MNFLKQTGSGQIRTVESLLHPYSPPDTTLVDRLRYWTSAEPDRIAYAFLGDGENIDESVTYAELDRRVRANAARLIARGLRGQRALLMYPSGIDFIVSFLACQYAGVAAVPAYPPRRNRNMGRISGIADDAATAVALTIRDVIERRSLMNLESSALENQPWLATDETPIELESDWVNPGVRPDELSIIQYTSGSTGSPKGVMLTHANVLANCRYITLGFQLSTEHAGCCWLPVYHDMGLIGGLLASLFCGTTSYLMAPVHFLSRPARWLKAISRFKAVVAGGPNFAYGLCVDKITEEECAGLDLSSWRVAFNGAEPIRADVLDRFTSRFAQYGFNHRAHYPCYGMAETTLLVTGGDPEKDPVVCSFDSESLTRHRVVPVEPDAPGSRKLVGCGQTLLDEEVVIVHPEARRRMKPDEIGEIWVSSQSVGQGYWKKAEDTARTFQATLVDNPEKQFLRTGDLGFFLDGELYVAGRLKDMIIVRGVNRYPQDIEATAERSSSRLRTGGAAAFAVEHWDRERLVVVCETDRGPDIAHDEIIQRIRADVTVEHELPPDEVVLVRSGSIPKTSSGKVQRHACRQQYLENRLLIVAKWSVDDGGPQAESATEASPQQKVKPEILELVYAAVRSIARERARSLSPSTNIVLDLGLDSLERLQIANALEKSFGARFPDEVLQEIETVGEVAAAVEKHLGSNIVLPAAGESEQRPASTKPEEPREIPESHYVIEKMPEFIRYARLRRMIEESGIRNPYFSVHEGKIGDTTRIDGRELISFSSYNYLGMSGDPEVGQAAIEAINRFGTSVSASRLVSGEKTIHKDLERELAEFLGVEDVITFAGGHATNETVIGHMVKTGDLILHDALAHNSIIKGAELSGARRRPFTHNSWEELDSILSEIRHEYSRVLIAIEGLYSMDGDSPDLTRFVEVKKRHKAMLLIDEAHSIGTLGKTGRGIGELHGIPRGDVDMWMGTLSKAFGAAGGFIAARHNLVEYLRYTTPGFVFAAGLNPGNVGAALGSLRKLVREPEHVQTLASVSKLFLDLAKQAGLNTGPSKDSPIIPIITGSSLLALRLSEALFHNGINAQPILHPAVEENQARVRFFITRLHKPDQVRYTVDVLKREWDKIAPRK